MKRVGFLVGVLVLVVLVGMVRAQIFHVSTAQEFQDALTEAQQNGEGDTIYLAAGTYDVDALGATFTYQAASRENYPISILGAGIDKTILKSSKNDLRVLYVRTGSNEERMPSAAITIRGLTVQEGNSGGKEGGGLFVYTEDADITLEEVKVFQNQGYHGGGGYVKSARAGFVTIKNCQVLKNSGKGESLNGVGLYVQGARVQISDSLFRENYGVLDWLDNRGGGLRVVSKKIKLSHCQFIKNKIEGGWYQYGGGAYLTGDGADIEVADCVFDSNLADDNEGALGIKGSEISVHHCTFKNNTARGSHGALYIRGENIKLYQNTFHANSAGGVAGAVRIQGGMVDIHDNVFTDNSAGSSGGALYLSGEWRWFLQGKVYWNLFRNNRISAGDNAYGGALCVVHPDRGRLDISIFDNQFFANRLTTSKKGYGGALHLHSREKAVIYNNIFSGNEVSAMSKGSFGGQVDLYLNDEGKIYFLHNTVYGGFADFGGGLVARLDGDNTSLFLYNNIIYANEADEKGNDLYLYDDWDNNGIGAAAEVFFNDFGQGFYQDGDNFTSGNNMSQDPRLTNPGAGDFHLTSTSPCIDAGSDQAPNLPDKDMEGDQRIIGQAPDIGADEYGGGQPSNEPPVIDSFNANPTSGNVPLTVTFTCQAHDPDGGTISSIDWYFGDSSNPYQTAGNSSTVTHTYNSPGTYQAHCVVRDDEGQNATSDEIGITVNPSASSNYTFHVSVNPEGAGSVTGPGIDCPGDCNETYQEGTDVVLTANPDPKFSFNGWSGDCENCGNDTSCTVTMDKNKSCQANFSPKGPVNSDAWLAPSERRVTKNSNFVLHFHVNSASQNVSAYDITISFDPDLVQIDTSKGVNGIEPGPDALDHNTPNPDNTNGSLHVVGIDANGVGPGSDLDLLTIHFKALENTGTADIGLSVIHLSNTDGIDRGPFEGKGSTVIIKNIKTGDTSGDGEVDIIDALFVARYVVGFEVSTFHPEAADVNCDDKVNIIDALFIARKVVGLPVKDWCGN